MSVILPPGRRTAAVECGLQEVATRIRGSRGPIGRLCVSATTLVVFAFQVTVAANAAHGAVQAAAVEGLLDPQTVNHSVAAGECFAAILARHGIPTQEAHEWCQAARSEVDLRHISVGHNIALAIDENQQLRSLRYDINDEKQLVVERTPDGQLSAGTESLPVQVREVGARGIVRTSFYQAAQEAGVPDPIISMMVDLLAWKIDFSSEVRAGDRFRILYEQRTRYDGQPLKPGRILAADFLGAAQSAAAFLYENERGEQTYFDHEGRVLEGALLRYPVEFTRISSAFTRSRFHPILKKRRPHLGVDLVARSGTAVRAIGSGKVRWAGWKGGLGRHVEVDHGDGLVSAYSHLRGIRREVRRGGHVKRGQLIGWVGQSGLATGPHLHFAIFQNGRYTNPLKLHRPLTTISKIPAQELGRVRTALTARLRQVPGSYRPASSTPPIALSALAQAHRHGPVILTL